MLELLVVSPSRLLGQGLVPLARRSQIRVSTAATIDDYLRAARGRAAWEVVVIDDLCIYSWDDAIIQTAARLQSKAKRVLFAEPFLTSEVTSYLEQGLHGVLNKRAPPSEFLDGCRAIAAGTRVVAAPWKDGVQAGGMRQHLTARQLEILGLVADGCSNKRIAEHLGCSTNTVKAHLRAVYHVLGVHTRIECLQAAHRNGWIATAITRK